METIQQFFGKSKYWWSVLLLGILLFLLGFWMLYSPIQGYALIANLFGWSLIVTGIFESTVATSMERRLPGWGWWLAGGIIDVIVGVILVSNIVLAAAVLPFCFAFIFLYKGVQNVVASFVIAGGNRAWWLYLINGLLMLIIAWMFFTSPASSAFMTDFLVAVYFIYWGAALAAMSFDLKPAKR
jgi:uncharacterized membrane protein HdeD (DUF308 family)